MIRSDKMSDKLLPCPFCGGEAKFTYITKVYTDYPSIRCSNDECFAGKLYILFNTEVEAITAWNTRKPMERIEEKLDEAMERQWGYYNKAKGEGNIRQMDYSDGCAEGLTTAIELLEEELN